MATSALSVGIATGTNQGMKAARLRRLEDRRLARQERAQDLSMQRDEQALAMNEENAGYLREDRDRLRTLQGREDTQYTEDRARTRTLRGREDVEWEQRQQQIQDEGLQEFAASLMQGADPTMAIRRFNEIGELKFDDKQSRVDGKQLHLVDDDGEVWDGTLEEFAASMGIEPQKPERQDLMATDKPIYDPNTKQWIQPPQQEGGELSPSDRYEQVGDYIFDKQTREFIAPPGGDNGGRDVSPYNPETVQQRIGAEIVRTHGGQAGEIEELTDPETRNLVQQEVAAAHDMEGRLRQHVMDGRLTVGEIANAVTTAAKDTLVSDNELDRMGEEWRTKGFNKSDDEKAQWVAAERASRVAEFQAKLAEAEQQLLGESAEARQEDEASQMPDQAKKAVDDAIAAGQSSVKFRNGQVWTKRNGRYIRLDSGSPTAAVKPAPMPEPEATLASTTPYDAAATRRRVDLLDTADQPTRSSRSGRNRSTGDEATVGRTLGAVGENIREAASSGRQRGNRRSNITDRAANAVRNALEAKRAPLTEDILRLAELSPEALAGYGFTPEQTSQIKATAARERL